MRTRHPSSLLSYPFAVRLSAALAASIGALVAVRLYADEPGVASSVTSTAPAPQRLATQAEIDAVNLSIVDEKLALSLAVETHVQIELAEFALAGMHNAELKRFTEKKLEDYRRLLATTADLTGGRSTEMLIKAARIRGGHQGPAVIVQPAAIHEPATATVASSTKTAAAGEPNPAGGIAVPSAPVSAAAPPAVTAVPASAKRKVKIGLAEIVQNNAAAAVLRVRLEIAQQYADLLRTELQSAPPSEFDRRYLGIEVFNQMQVLAMLRVFEAQASDEFARIIHRATLASEGHVAEVRHLVEQLTKVPADSSAVR